MGYARPHRAHAVFFLSPPQPTELKQRIKNTMSEIIFVVEDAPEGGFIAKALGASIITQVQSIDALHTCVRDAVCCHFDEGQGPSIIRLHFVKDEVIAA